MLRSAVLGLGLGLTGLLFGCGDSCESLQEEIQAIGREIQENPESAMERGEELAALRDKLQEAGCLP